MGNNKIIDSGGNRYFYMSDYNQVINEGMRELFLKHGGNRKITIRDVAVDEKEIRKRVRNLPKMTFEITQNCNLRCKYCIFNGHYDNHRQLSPRNMDFETARKGLDYIFSLIKDRKKKEFTLSFYGGEPLLNIDTIKQVLAYGKRLFSGWDLRFSMTTNLTLLTEDILDFLVENDFILLVSLDGGKENHDAKRVYANGKGTFDTVYKNLGKMAARYKDYFEKIGFSAVFSPDLSFKKLHEFFMGDKLVKDKRTRYGMVNQRDTTYYEEYPCNWEKYHREYNFALLSILDKVRRGETLTTYEGILFEDSKNTGAYLQNRSGTYLADTCVFDSRLYIDVSGRFHVCEKINNTFPFGDVERGCDFERMAAIANEYMDVIKTHCSDCDARFLCGRCFLQFAGNGRFELDPEFCSQQRESIFNGLARYIRYKEEGLA